MTQNTVINETQGNFTVVLNQIINYKGKSMKCLGLYVYLASKPSNWKFNDTDISNHFTDGKTALNSAKTELKELGLLSIEAQRNEKGHITSWIWRITALIKEPVQNTENPTSSEIHNVENTTSSETSTYSNTNSINKTNINNIKKTSNKFDAETYIQTLDISLELKESLVGLIEIRKIKKTATSQRSIDMIIKDLQSWYNTDILKQIKCVNQSVKSGWTGVFEIKESANKTSNYQSNDWRDKRTKYETPDSLKGL